MNINQVIARIYRIELILTCWAGLVRFKLLGRVNSWAVPSKKSSNNKVTRRSMKWIWLSVLKNRTLPMTLLRRCRIKVYMMRAVKVLQREASCARLETATLVSMKQICKAPSNKKEVLSFAKVLLIIKLVQLLGKRLKMSLLKKTSLEINLKICIKLVIITLFPLGLLVDLRISLPKWVPSVPRGRGGERN